MKDKETWNIRIDRGEMEKFIEYNMIVYHEKRVFFKKKSFSSNVKQSTVFFSMNDSFLTLWINTPRPNSEMFIS